MTQPLRSLYGTLFASEPGIVLRPLAGTGAMRSLVYCHGSGVDGLGAYNATNQGQIIRALAESFTVASPDLGLEAWGNDTHITRIGQAKTYLETAPWSATGPVVLVAASMGVLGAMAYTLANPTLVGGIIAMIPALDINDLVVNNRAGGAAAINAAYGGTYSNVTHGPTHNPVLFAASLPNIPIHVFTSSNDPLAVPSTAAAFMAARPSTIPHDLGAVLHGDSSLAGIAPTVAALAVSMMPA